jgi:hypothetical protein
MMTAGLRGRGRGGRVEVGEIAGLAEKLRHADDALCVDDGDAERDSRQGGDAGAQA